MPYFSAFWKKHYKEIGTCCITSPMEKETVLDTKGKRLVSFIDVGWMNNKKLKWIGHDWDMYFAWIDPNGMIYRFKDLKRNEAGEEYEKNVRKLEIPNEGGHHHPSFSNKHDFYMWEYEVQKNCGFCPKDTAGQGGKGKPDSKKDDADSADAVPGGGMAGTGVEKEEKKETEQLAANTEPTDPTEHTDTTYTEHVTDTKAVQNEEEENQLVTDYAKSEEKDDPKQILDELKEKKDEKADNDEKITKPPKQEEKTEKQNKVTKPVIPPKKDNKVLNSQKVTDNKQVTKTVVPKNLQKTTQQRTDEILSKYRQPEPIDHLRVEPLWQETNARKGNPWPVRRPAFTNESNETVFVKPDYNVTKNGELIEDYNVYKEKIRRQIGQERKQNKQPPLPEAALIEEARLRADSTILYWHNSSVAVPPHSTFDFPIDGVTKKGLGYVLKVNRYNNRDARINKNGDIVVSGINFGGGKKYKAPDESWNDIIKSAQ